MTNVIRTQAERDALEAAARAICERRFQNFDRMGDLFIPDAEVAITAYLSALEARGMRVIQESELQNAEGALFNAEQYFKMFADEITSDYPARTADDESRPHRLGLCAKLAGESARELYALIYGEPYQEPVYCGPDDETPSDAVRIGKNPQAQPSIEQNLKTQSDGGKG